MAINAYSSSYYNSLLNRVNPVYRNNYLSDSAFNMLSGLNSLNSLNGLTGLTGANTGYSSGLDSLSGMNTVLANLAYKVNSTAAATGVKDYLTTLKTGSQAVKDSLAGLMGTAKTQAQAFTPTAAASSDAGKLTVDNSGAGTAAFDALKLNIDQLASGQLNEGKAMTADDIIGKSDLYEFSVETGGTSYQLAVSASAGDTNKALQQRMADAVNKKDIGIAAFVSEDTTKNTSTLTLRSKETGGGEQNQFSIQDIYGDAVALTGAGTVSRQAQDALYRINGGEQKTSASNTIALGNGVKATMLEASGNAIEVSAKPSVSSGAADAVYDLAESYNTLVAAAKSNGTESALQLNYQLALTTNTYASSLNRIGVSMDAFGKMVVNEDKLNSAAESGELEELFTQDRNSNYGFANRLSKLAGDIYSNPVKYADLSGLGYSNFNNNLYSSLQTSRYNQAYNTGLFMNMFV